MMKNSETKLSLFIIMFTAMFWLGIVKCASWVTLCFTSLVQQQFSNKYIFLLNKELHITVDVYL